MKPTWFVLTTLILASLPVVAADEQTITVTDSSLVKGIVDVTGTSNGSLRRLFCDTSIPSCIQPPPGQYSMVRADGDGVYSDCTNVVLYTLSKSSRKKVGLYCWVNSGECYISSCPEVETIPAHDHSHDHSWATSMNASDAKHAGVIASDRAGYIDCTPHHRTDSVYVFEHPCWPVPAAIVSCGQAVTVLGRKGNWLSVSSQNGIRGYVGIGSVSQRRDSFLAIYGPGEQAPPLDLDECNVVRAQHAMDQPPQPLDTPLPEYTGEALLAGIEGSVRFIITVGRDGRVQETTVKQGLGAGLDEQAASAVKTWTYAPALKNGKPVPATITIEVPFLTHPEGPRED